MSTEPIEQAFRSVTADMFGYFIRTKLVARQIAAAIESPGKQAWIYDKTTVPPFLNNQDAILVVEIGEDFLAGRGFTRAGTWLQHH